MSAPETKLDTRFSRCRRHELGRHASGSRGGRALLDHNRPPRRQTAHDATRSGLARRRDLLLHGPSEQKAVNLTHNPHVVLTTGCNEWEHGTDVVVEGTAVRVTDDPKLRRLASAWGRKWDGRWRYEVVDGAFEHEPGRALVFEVEPTKVLAFGKGTVSQTRHRFAPNQPDEHASVNRLPPRR